MYSRQRFFTLTLVLILGIASTGVAFGQTSTTAQATITASTEDPQDEIDMEDSTAQIDDTALLIKLSTQFNVELSVIQDLSAQGYTAEQIWLALEISNQSGEQLSVAVTQVSTMHAEGHGWGVLAQALGIDPGSERFFELKEQMRTHTRTMASEIETEYSPKLMVKEKERENESESEEEQTETNAQKHAGFLNKLEDSVANRVLNRDEEH